MMDEFERPKMLYRIQYRLQDDEGGTYREVITENYWQVLNLAETSQRSTVWVSVPMWAEARWI